MKTTITEKTVLSYRTLLIISTITLIPICANAQARPPTDLSQRWAAANESCRGGSGDDPATYAACGARTEIDHEMRKLGWCYQATWRRCAR